MIFKMRNFIVRMKVDFQHKVMKSETEFKCEGDYEVEYDDLRKWAVQSRIPHCHFDSLLKILQRVLPKLPKSSKTFLRTTACNYVVENMVDAEGSQGELTYMGIVSWLNYCVKNDFTLIIYFNWILISMGQK